MHYIMVFKSLKWHAVLWRDVAIDLIWSLRELNEFVVSRLYYNCQEFYDLHVTFGQFMETCQIILNISVLKNDKSNLYGWHMSNNNIWNHSSVRYITAIGFIQPHLCTKYACMSYCKHIDSLIDEFDAILVHIYNEVGNDIMFTSYLQH